MTWAAAFVLQAASDLAAFDLLSSSNLPDCHRIHYLQMSAEKLAKALLAKPDSSNPPAYSHAVLVNGLRVLMTRRDYQRRMGFENNTERYQASIRKLLPVARQLELLTPALARSGPNTEYPWRAKPSAPVVAPAEYMFPSFNPRNIEVAQLIRFYRRLVQLLSES